MKATTSDMVSTMPSIRATTNRQTDQAAPPSLVISRGIPVRWVKSRRDELTTSTSAGPAVASKRGASAWIHSNTESRSSTTSSHVYTTASLAITLARVLTNLAKWNSLSFPGFPDRLSSLFQTIIKRKPDVKNHCSSHFGIFFAQCRM